MLEDFQNFILLKDANLRYVILSIILLGASSGLVGTFSFLRKKALVGETIAHSMLPGITLAFLLSGVKDPFYLLIGAVISAWLSILALDYLTNHTKVKPDAALAIILTVFFGLGMMLMVSIQHTDILDKSGLDHYIFGKAAAMTKGDIKVFGSIGILILVIVLILYKEFKLMSFNPEFAKVIGLPTKTLEFILSTLTILTIATGIKAVGIILMAALLIIPPAAARYWTDKLDKMIAIAVIFGVISGILGAFVSYTAPRMPTGPWTVLSLSLLIGLSIVFAPHKGIIAESKKRRLQRDNILRENFLKSSYQLMEKSMELDKFYNLKNLNTLRWFSHYEINKLKGMFKRSDEVEFVGDNFRLNGSGIANGKRINRLHRLWEIYLSQRMNIKTELVHKNAETIEHLITPEIEKQILKELELCENFNPTAEIHKPIQA